jgi:hypothetical protein
MIGEPISTADAKALASVSHAAKVIHGLLSQDGAQDAEGAAAVVDPAQGATPAPEDAEPQGGADSAQPADQTSDDGTPPQPSRSRKLTIDGQEEEVTEDEAYLGYLRQRDYTQKTQLTAAQRKKAEDAERAASEARQELIQALEEVKQGLTALVPAEPDWATLQARMTPEQFTAAFAEYQTFKRQYDAVVARQKQEQQKEADLLSKRLEEYRETQAERLTQAIPEWADETVRKADKAKIRQYAKTELGLSDQEIADISDARVVIGLRNSMLWHELQQKGSTVTPTKPKLKPAAPGVTPAPVKPQDEKSRAFERQRKSGKIDDTAKVFEHLLG